MCRKGTIFRVRGCGWLVFLWLACFWLAGWVVAADLDAEAGSAGQMAGNTGDAEPGAADKAEQDKRKFKLKLAYSGVAVGLVFAGAVLLLAIGRYYRRRLRLGEKGKPTEYVDAWSQHRLKENWRKDYEDDNDDDS